ncbi:sensor histidine kinase [Sphingomonas sp.]|uniref:sensor histidine kinase n=1 Tax=Sphingomonas sp. TaxID=28214 RepID=UPI002DD64379|nr:ATP-binding protein [Sphingomonas sp.]
MPRVRPLPILAALALVAGAALTVGLITSDPAAAIVVAVIGAAAVLLAASAPAPAPSAEDGHSRRDGPAIDTLLDAVGDPLILVGGTRVLAANIAARRLLGDHVVGEDVRLAIRHPAAATRLVAPGDGTDDPVELAGLGGRDQTWSLRVSAAGERRVIHLSDHSAGAAADRIRVDFVANASHELRTPLAAILGFVETLREGAGDDPVTRDRFLAVIDTEARRMERLVGDLMSLSRIEAEKFRAPEDAVDLVALAREVCVELSASDGARGGELTLEVPDSAEVHGDRAQLSQLLHNIAGNALKYGRPGTPVTIAVARDEDGGVRLSVADQGDGIPSEHLPRLTERFYRVDPGRSRAIGGTGLGLAIVKHIVERHRGRLTIASEPGVGTTVAVVLPPAMSSSRNESATEG